MPSSRTRRNPLFAVGVTLTPDAPACANGRWYTANVLEDLDTAAACGCGLVRLLVSWRELEPQVGQYSDEALHRLQDMVLSATSRKLKSVICFFPDDRHSELSEVTWAQRRDPRQDPYLLEREQALVSEVVGTLESDPGIFAWQLGDDAFISGFADSEQLESWMATMIRAIREHDSKRLVGFGADVESLFRRSGLDAAKAASLCDYTVVHATSAFRNYAAPALAGSIGGSYLEAYLLRLARSEKPVLLDEIGPQSHEASVLEEAEQVRLGLWTGFCNRAAGSMVRRMRDYAAEQTDLYRVDPLENLVGMLDVEGAAKPSLSEVAAFTRAIGDIDLKTHALVAERAAVLVPSECYGPPHSLGTLFTPRACLRAFVAMKQAHVPVKLVREDDSFAGLSLIVVPSAFGLDATTFGRLADFVDEGGTLVTSFGGTEPDMQFRTLFGVDFLGNAGPRESLACRVAQPEMLGGLESFTEPLALSSFGLLAPRQASVIATDDKGSPLVTVTVSGRGRVVLFAAPLERALAQAEQHYEGARTGRLVREVYAASARMAGCAGAASCDAPDVELALFQGEDDDVLVLLNHSGTKSSATVTMDRKVASVGPVDSRSPSQVNGHSFAVTLGSHGVAVLRMKYE